MPWYCFCSGSSGCDGVAGGNNFNSSKCPEGQGGHKVEEREKGVAEYKKKAKKAASSNHKVWQRLVFANVLQHFYIMAKTECMKWLLCTPAWKMASVAKRVEPTAGEHFKRQSLDLSRANVFSGPIRPLSRAASPPISSDKIVPICPSLSQTSTILQPSFSLLFHVRDS